ncbi:hypothetical protein BDF20DRAFT_849877 [Mycotypha africana]|uniref:uncharacterized protein n=1 Tax=Mycotypha africana TaxID=64632 RepID=UPI002301BBDF|nr:uncharacterized protein BDF20DRAFT_849877 [Mycotypha africana]KAI8987379.1 hypothetical protein BDF20DRAFT_849877 [Mycotypha africana]
MRLLSITLIISLSILFVDGRKVYKRAEETGSVSSPSAQETLVSSSQPQATSIAVATAQTGSGSPVIGSTAAFSGNGTQANATQSAPVNNANPFAGKPTYASFSNDIPPAYLTWKKPIPNQTFPPLYKIGVSNITFEWTVDPKVLKVQPANLTVALANPQKQTYTAAVVPGTATSANWDLARLPPESPLMVGYYTVWVYDQRGPKAFPSPGWLMPDSRLVVAMYSTEAYVGRTDSMFCPTCYLGGSRSFHESFMPLITAVGVAVITSIVILVSALK